MSLVRREVLNDGRCWCEIDAELVHEDDGLLVTYIPPGAPIRYPLGFHPWYPKPAWEGDGVLMLHRPADWYSVWRFRHAWYVNFQEPYRRWEGGYDTQDLELDIVIPDAGPWTWKDRELLEQRVREGRFTPEQAARTRAEAERLGADIDAGRVWWDAAWAEWSPEP